MSLTLPETLGELIAYHDDPDMCRAHRQLVAELKRVLAGLEERLTAEAEAIAEGDGNYGVNVRHVFDAIRAELRQGETQP